MSTTDQLLLFAVAFCLAFLVFSTKKLASDLKRLRKEREDNVIEIGRLRQIIHAMDVEGKEEEGSFLDDLADNYPPCRIDWADDPPY